MEGTDYKKDSVGTMNLNKKEIQGKGSEARHEDQFQNIDDQKYLYQFLRDQRSNVLNGGPFKKHDGQHTDIPTRHPSIKTNNILKGMSKECTP